MKRTLLSICILCLLVLSSGCIQVLQPMKGTWEGSIRDLNVTLVLHNEKAGSLYFEDDPYELTVKKTSPKTFEANYGWWEYGSYFSRTVKGEFLSLRELYVEIYSGSSRIAMGYLYKK